MGQVKVAPKVHQTCKWIRNSVIPTPITMNLRFPIVKSVGLTFKHQTV